MEVDFLKGENEVKGCPRDLTFVTLCDTERNSKINSSEAGGL
jgi:hypothetical protein